MTRAWHLAGMAAAGVGVAGLALVSQLWWLTSEGWQMPALRVAAAVVGGAGVGLGLWWVVRRLWGEVWAVATGLGLGASGMGTLVAWVWLPGIFGDGWAWVVGAVAVGAVAVGRGVARAVALGRGVRLRAEWVVVGAVVLGAIMRVAGIGHGLPSYIMHCDTPKQLERIPWFVEGQLNPLSDYPMGHIYLYSGVIAAAKALSGLDTTLARLAPGRVDKAMGYILSARGLQVAMGLGVVLGVWAVARRLWGGWAGALAAVLVALDPLHMTYSRQVMGEVPQCMWVWLAVACGVMLMRGGGMWWAWWGGVCAGLGVATKIYGGYCLALVWAGAWLCARDWRWKAKALGLGLAGLAAGVVVGSPYLWVDPEGWWEAVAGQSVNQFYTGTSFVQSLEAAHKGLIYLWGVVWRRYGPVWIALMGVGLAWSVARALKGRKEEVFFTLALGIALALVLVFRLRYLREWDLVNLVPFLEAAAAGALVQWCSARRSWARWAGAMACLGLVGAMGAIALSDAWVAMAPDTRVAARRWLVAEARAGQRLAWNLPMSGAYAMWLPQNLGLRLDGGGRQWDLGVEEWAWFASPPGGFTPRRPGPVALFRLRNYFWENPTIAAYIHGISPWPGAVVLGPRALSPGGMGYLLTPWARRRGLQLAAGWGAGRGARESVGVGSLETAGWVALGRGRARLMIGPGIGMPIKVEMGRVTGGIVRPIRAIVPVHERVYKFSLIRCQPAPIVWVGIFPQPVEGAALAARMGDWELAGRLAEASLAAAQPPPEAWLWAAAAAAARGETTRAKQLLSALSRHHPGFIRRYTSLCRLDPSGLARIASAGGAALNAGAWRWPPPTNDKAELYRGQAPGYHHSGPEAWVSSGRLLLPGPWRLTARVSSSSPSRITVVARMGGDWAQVLAWRRLAAGESVVETSLTLPRGPAMVEVHLSCLEGRAMIHEVLMRPDWKAEMRWRAKVMAKVLALGRGQGR